MHVTIKKRPISFVVKIAIAIIISSIIGGILLRIFQKEKMERALEFALPTEITVTDEDVLIPVICLPVNASAHEKEWTSALANKLRGKEEVRIDRGRIDVMTESYAIEVDFIKKWHEGLGQAIHYGFDSNRTGVLALVDKNNELDNDKKQRALLRKIDRLCTDKSIKLILLKPQK